MNVKNKSKQEEDRFGVLINKLWQQLKFTTTTGISCVKAIDNQEALSEKRNYSVEESPG